MEENLFLQFYVLGAPLDFSFGLGKFGDILFWVAAQVTVTFRNGPDLH